MASVHPETNGSGEDHGHGHAHSPYLHHHFETEKQQFESDKLGMWLFLATEVLMFGGLFCAYSVYRHNHPEVFHYAHVHLNKVMGAANTVVLIFSSFTMAWSIKAIQEGKKALCIALLAITLCCAATFMVIKYFEYSAKIEHGLLWGPKYHPHHEGEHAASDMHASAATPAVGHEQATAAAPAGGLVEAGHDEHTIADSVAEKQTPMPVVEDAALGDGEDAAHATEVAAESTGDSHAVPPVIDESAKTQETGSTPARATASAPGTVAEVPQSYVMPGALKIEPTKIKPAALPPAGLKTSMAAADDHGPEPKNVQTFFAIYFAMTGLHGIHVLAGMIAISIMMGMVIRGKYNKDYWTPIDLTGLFWHVVDLIWIFLFPLLYLIS